MLPIRVCIKCKDPSVEIKGRSVSRYADLKDLIIVDLRCAKCGLAYRRSATPEQEADLRQRDPTDDL